VSIPDVDSIFAWSLGLSCAFMALTIPLPSGAAARKKRPEMVGIDPKQQQSVSASSAARSCQDASRNRSASERSACAAARWPITEGGWGDQ